MIEHILLYSKMLDDLGLVFLKGVEAQPYFWYCFIIVFITYGVYVVFAEDEPLLSLAGSLIAAFAIFIYVQLDGDPFWYIDWETSSWYWWLFCAMFTIGVVVMAFQTFWAHICLIKYLFRSPVNAIIGVLVGIVWFAAAMCMVGTIVVNHSLLCILALFVSIGSLSGGTAVPTIYVKDEGHITGHGYDGGSRFHGDNGNDYHYTGNEWFRD